MEASVIKQWVVSLHEEKFLDEKKKLRHPGF